MRKLRRAPLLLNTVCVRRGSRCWQALLARVRAPERITLDREVSGWSTGT